MIKKTFCVMIIFGTMTFLGWIPWAKATEFKGLLGSTRSSSSHYSYFAAAGKVINDFVPGVKLTIVESVGSEENLNRIRDGGFHLGLITDSAAYTSYYGLEKWKEKPVKNLRQFWNYVATPLTIVVTEDSQVKSISELAGKKFCPGGRGTSSEWMMDMAFKVLGIKVNAYRGSIDEHMAAFKDRVIIGYQKPAASPSIPDASTIEVMPFMKIRVLGFSHEDIKKITSAYPYFSVVPIAANTYNADWNKKDILTLAIVVGCGGRSDIPEDVAYKIVKTIWEHRKPQESAFNAFKDAKPEMVLWTNTPLHPGAVRYYREIGIKIPDKLLPP